MKQMKLPFSFIFQNENINLPTDSSGTQMTVMQFREREKSITTFELNNYLKEHKIAEVAEGTTTDSNQPKPIKWNNIFCLKSIIQ